MWRAIMDQRVVFGSPDESIHDEGIVLNVGIDWGQHRQRSIRSILCIGPAGDVIDLNTPFCYARNVLNGGRG